MNINEIREALRKLVIGLGIYVLVSLIFGAFAAAVGWPFWTGFLPTTAMAGILYWFRDDLS